MQMLLTIYWMVRPSSIMCLVSIENTEKWYTEFAKELTLERAQQDLSDCWRAWLKENVQGKGRGTKNLARR
jgi:hypothetical protein